MNNFKTISRKLIDWYELHKRALPWRETHNPYKIWISEIILQQTRVAQGMEYYLRFVKRFPNVKTLADADEQEVLKYWQGLGYYSRARNLHFAAKHIQKEFQGIFPKDYESIRYLKGIGEYTAAAIASFAYNLPYPAIDGNVLRVISRLFAIEEPIDTSKGKKTFTEIGQALIDRENPGIFNQAMMEFGALQCTPSSPDCSSCPIRVNCLGYSLKKETMLPIKANRTKTQNRYLYYFRINYKDRFFLRKREEKGIWQNLFEFPLIESEIPLDFEKLTSTKEFQELFSGTNPSGFKQILSKKKHVLSHRILFADFYELQIENINEQLNSYIYVTNEEFTHYPIHRLMELYFEI